MTADHRRLKSVSGTKHQCVFLCRERAEPELISPVDDRVTERRTGKGRREKEDERKGSADVWLNSISEGESICLHQLQETQSNTHTHKAMGYITVTQTGGGLDGHV